MPSSQSPRLEAESSTGRTTPGTARSPACTRRGIGHRRPAGVVRRAGRLDLDGSSALTDFFLRGSGNRRGTVAAGRSTADRARANTAGNGAVVSFSMARPTARIPEREWPTLALGRPLGRPVAIDLGGAVQAAPPTACVRFPIEIRRPAVPSGARGAARGGGHGRKPRLLRRRDRRGFRGLSFCALWPGMLLLAPGAAGAPPIITVTISGTLGLNGWYKSNVTVNWQVDGETSSEGCDTRNLTVDTPLTAVTCKALNENDGAEASQTVTSRSTRPRPP